jgi:hypothetical protein
MGGWVKAIRLSVLMSLISPLWNLAAMTQEKATQPERLGKVHFHTSCNTAAPLRFDRTMALLHARFFLETVRAFTAVTEADPICAMSHGGWWFPLCPVDRTMRRRGPGPL